MKLVFIIKQPGYINSRFHQSVKTLNSLKYKQQRLTNSTGANQLDTQNIYLLCNK